MSKCKRPSVASRSGSALSDDLKRSQHELWARTQLRSVRFAGLLIAATAELQGLVVIHYDSDYDAIAAVTNQPTEWVVPPDSIS